MRRLRGSALLAGALAVSGGVVLGLPATATAADPGLFHPYTAYQPGSSAANIAIGDVTGDGRADVVLTTDYDFDAAKDFSVWVYPQQSDGTLGTPSQLKTDATYGSTMAVALADLDGDGDLDAAVTTNAGVEIYEQRADGLAYSWTVPIQAGRDLELADVSGDALADLVVNAQDGVQVWWQVNGDFMPSPAGSQLTTAAQTEVEVADATGDGRADVVSAHGGTLDVRAQQADHSFAAPVSYTSGGTDPWTTINGLAVGDTNGDGLADVHVSVGGNKPNSWVVTRVQLPDGTLAKPYVRQSYDIPESIEVADVTGDGLADLVVLHGGWNEMGVYDSTPGTNSVETLYPIPYASHYKVKGLAIGDVSGDGRADVAEADYNNGLVLLRGAEAGADTSAPHTTITSGPTGTVRSRTVTYGFTANETSTFECSLDSAAWTPCSSPMTYDGLSAGQHTFMVRATDTAGNTDAMPARTSFAVDGPDTTITSGPTGTVRSKTATFAISASPAAASFECSMDNAAWQTCSPQVTYTGLATATTHTLRVRAVSSDGLVDSTPATRTFSVDSAADVAVTVGGAPNPVKRGGTLTYTAQVSNVGPNAAAGVVFTQGLPTDVTFTSVTATPGSPTSAAASCTASGSPTTVRCQLGNLNPGTTWTVTVKATVDARKGSLASAAVATTATWDLNAGNDSASTSTTVNGNGK
jgi:uncharacterized repeat protein (TIGR01451 family)